MNREQLKEMQADALERLMALRSADGMWRGLLSSSAISTSVSVFALHSIDAEKYKKEIAGGIHWLQETMCPDGSWGDSVESPSNMTATLLTYVSLVAVGEKALQTRAYLNARFGGDSEEALINGVLDYYGKDLTFSVPILMMCALAGVVKDWKKIPPFPFELATLPQRFFRFLNLPVVSYAIPALIAIGICQMRRKGGMFSFIREAFVPKAMRELVKLQPADGGFLEAAPLTAFVSMCLAEGGFREHEVTQKCAQFLVDTVREDGSWPIDTNLASWVTSLSIKILGKEFEGRDKLADIIQRNATRAVHPFTGAAPGGWGWSDLSGSVPDGDDTSGALVALHALGYPCDEVICNGINWLMILQNNDGGMPTFCKGWGKLPFDRSSPDITSHAVLAMGLWMKDLPSAFRVKVEKSFTRLLDWLEKNQDAQHGWTPLWFGDQDAADEHAPVYGTAIAIDYLMATGHPRAVELAERQLGFLLQTQNADGGWGGNLGVRSKVTYTSRVLAALSWFQGHEAVKNRAWDYLYETYKTGHLYDEEPIGLYFSRLWYSEKMYNLTFLLWALKRYTPLSRMTEKREGIGGKEKE